MELNEEIKKRRKENWIEAWFAIEAMAVKEETVKNSLEKHVEMLSKVNDVFIYEKKFSELRKIEKPIEGIEVAYSQIAEIKLFVKNLFLLTNIVIVYGPSSIEILGPANKEVKIEEIQNISNMLAGVVHQFATAGIGGILISPDK